jgi:hypothetical protein
MLVSEVLDRALTSWLWPSGVDRPAYDILNTTMTPTVPAAGATFTVLGRIQGNIPPDSLLEIGNELILLRDASTTTLTVQDRGWLDTVEANHAIGDKIYINPKYTRLTLLQALQSEIGQLWPDLYVKKSNTTLLFTNREVTVLPDAKAKRILSIMVRRQLGLEQYTTLTQEGHDWVFYNQFSPPKFWMRRGGGQGQPMIVTYITPIPVPVLETDDLTTLGVSETLQPYLPLAVAGHVLQSKEIPRVQIEEIRRMLALNNIQVGAALNVGGAMLRMFKGVVMAERRELRQSDPPQLAWARSE